MSLTCRPTIPADAYELAPNLRTEDVAEVKACSGRTPLEVLSEAYEVSSPCYTVVTENGNPVSMFGVVPLDDKGTFGQVWMLCSPLLIRYSKEFLRKSRGWIERLHRKYSCLTNVVDARNDTHVKWLEFMGASFVFTHKEYGVEKRPFREFVLCLPES